MTTNRVFKIMDEETGLFSTGGVNPKWMMVGKIWSSEATLKSHLTLWLDYIRGRDIPDSWVIITYEYTPLFSSKASTLASRPPRR